MIIRAAGRFIDTDYLTEFWFEVNQSLDTTAIELVCFPSHSPTEQAFIYCGEYDRIFECENYSLDDFLYLSLSDAIKYGDKLFSLDKALNEYMELEECL